jgi:hypothetical protein
MIRFVFDRDHRPISEISRRESDGAIVVWRQGFLDDNNLPRWIIVAVFESEADF